MAVMAACYNVGCPCCLDLRILDFPIFETFFLKTGLEITTAATATEVVALVRIGIHKVFFAYT